LNINGETGAKMVNETFGNMGPEKYIEERVMQYQDWYDKKSVKCKALYLRMRALSVVGAAIVPVLVNINVQYINYATTVISLIVVIFVSLESVLHYREQWKNYRSTQQYLNRERLYFLTKEGPYRQVNEKDAFVLFVERIESAIENENIATLSIMTLAAGPKEEKESGG
jgi:hypothetical protein